MPRRSSQQIGNDWEVKIRDFFSKLGFNVEGGASFRPGGHQVDVVAGIHNVLFIGECKTKQELGTSSRLSSEIEKFRKDSLGIIKDLKKGYRGEKYSSYEHFVLLMITKDIVWEEGDKEKLYCVLEGNPLKANGFDQDLLTYYETIKEELSDKIAKYHLLSDFNIKFPPRDSIKVRAIKQRIKNMEIYNFIATPQDMLPYVSVARRESRKKEYYQRMINGNRCEEIIEYLDKGSDLFPYGNIIPGNVIIASKPSTYLEQHKFDLNIGRDVELVTLALPSSYGAFWIVDGQHRFFAYSKKSRTRDPLMQQKAEDKILFTLLHNISYNQQKQIFVDINDKQKGVDKNYLIDVEGDSSPNTLMGKASRLIKKIDLTFLNQPAENIFYGRVKIPSHGISKSRKFSLKGFYEAIMRRNLLKPMTSSSGRELDNPFFSEGQGIIEDESSLDKLANNMIQFFDVSKRVLNSGAEENPEEDNFIYNFDYIMESGSREGFVDVLVGIFERIISALYKKNSRPTIPTVEDFRKYLEPVAVRLKSISTQDEFSALINTSGHGNRDDTVRKICSVIKMAGFIEFYFEDLDLGFNEIVKYTTKLERILRELINTRMLSLNYPDWCKGSNNNLLPNEMFNGLKAKASDDIEQNPSYISEGKLYKNLTLGGCKDLILKHWELVGFGRLFVVGNGKFLKKDQFRTALEHLTKYRNTEDHSMTDEPEREILKDQNQQSLANTYIKIINRVLKEAETIVDEDEESEPIEESGS